jgi:hypothetical protein
VRIRFRITTQSLRIHLAIDAQALWALAALLLRYRCAIDVIATQSRRKSLRIHFAITTQSLR